MSECRHLFVFSFRLDPAEVPGVGYSDSIYRSGSRTERQIK